MSILGTRVLRTEDPGFLSTGAIYTEDVQDERLAGACYVHFVRSTVAHAKINGIDTSAAPRTPGVIAVYTGRGPPADGLSPLKPMTPNMNQAMLQPLLASDMVRFVGEPVAAVVTEEMYQGEDAIELVDVDYDPLPAVVDMNDALAGDEGLLFPDGRRPTWSARSATRREQPGPVRGLRGRGQRDHPEPAGRGGADGDPRRPPPPGARTGG